MRCFRLPSGSPLGGAVRKNDYSKSAYKITPPFSPHVGDGFFCESSQKKRGDHDESGPKTPKNAIFSPKSAISEARPRVLPPKMTISGSPFCIVFYPPEPALRAPSRAATSTPRSARAHPHPPAEHLNSGALYSKSLLFSTSLDKNG